MTPAILIRPGLIPLLVVMLLGLAGPSVPPPAAATLPPGAPVGAQAGALAGSEQVPVGVWPLDPLPDVVAHFDPPDTPYGRGHRGVDLAGHVGAPVRAALPGRVSFAAPLAGRGVVVVDHGATRTTYEPVSAAVAVGDRVGAGDRIGYLDAGGGHCAPAVCLHWGWIEGETYLDPLLLVGAGPIRLLPLDGDRPTPATGSPWQPLIEWWDGERAQARG